VFGLFNAARSFSEYRGDTAIMHDGASAEARVTRKWEHEADSGITDYMVGYSFELPSGERIEGEHWIAVHRFRSLRQGDPIVVMYSRAQPDRNFPEGTGATSRSATWGVVTSVLFAVFGAVLILRHWNSGARRGARSGTKERGR
jgi:hypothetical protein